MKRQMMTGLALLTITAVTAAAASQFGNVRLNPQLDEMNKAIALNSMSHFNQLEIADVNSSLARLEHQEVIQFARKMNTEHTAAQEKVTELAEAEEVFLTSFSASTIEMASTEALEALDDGMDYDKGFLMMLIQNHERSLHNLEMLQKVVTDVEVKEALDQAIPTVRGHLNEAQELLTKLIETTPSPSPTSEPSPSPTTEPSPSPTSEPSPSPSPSPSPDPEEELR